MTRVLMATHGWGVLQDRYGNAQAAKAATFTNTNLSPATHWDSAVGGSSSTAAVVADSRGRLMRYIDDGSYLQTVDGETLAVEAQSATSVAAIAARSRLVELKRAAIQPTNVVWGGQALDSTLERGRSNSTGIALGVSGRLSLIGVVMIPAGRTVTYITVHSGATAMVTPANQWFCLIDTAAGNAILAKTVDNLTTAWGTSVTRTLALSTPYTPTLDTLSYIGVVITAATMPSVTGWTGASVDVGILSPVMGGLAASGLTTPASLSSVGAITGVATQGLAWVA